MLLSVRHRRKIILIGIISIAFFDIAFSYNKDMNNLINAYYSGYNDIDILANKAINSAPSKIEKQTYKNIMAVMKIRMKLEHKREIYNMLQKTLKENEPLLSESNPDYMTSVADLMSALIEYSTFNELMKLSGKANILYEDSLKINPNHFQALLGYGLSIAFKPKFVGGGIDKAIPIFKKAEENAKENWEKQVIYIWLSQAYMKMGNDEKYNKYIALGEKIFPEGVFFNMTKDMNDNENKSMFDSK